MLKRIAQLANLELSEDAILSIIFPPPCTMLKINKDFLNHDYLTDVICFNYQLDHDIYDDVTVEIFISPDIALTRSLEDKKLFYSSELVLYIVHGVLHASGELDTTEKQKISMRKKEADIIRILKTEFDFNEVFPN